MLLFEFVLVDEINICSNRAYIRIIEPYFDIHAFSYKHILADWVRPNDFRFISFVDAWAAELNIINIKIETVAVVVIVTDRDITFLSCIIAKVYCILSPVALCFARMCRHRPTIHVIEITHIII